jgi:thiol-disulfide isomerase/thioredoxin
MRYSITLAFFVYVIACLAEPLPTNRFQIWLKGDDYRQALLGKPMTMKFTAMNGRQVDLSQMRGKVVLIDFWQTECEPCVAEMPRIETALKKYHRQGFEVIGISDDTDKDKLERFLKDKKIPWPQYFEDRVYNQFIVEYGINSFPRMFLVDKKGCLRFDDVKAEGSRTNFEDKIEGLLAEK